MNTPFVICLMGPTASGKTDVAIELVQRLPCEIISVDSAMIYRSMDIGTAKPTADILKIAPHRLIDIRDPKESYSAGDFCTDVMHEIESILQAGKIPLLVGGTMLYFYTLQKGIAELPQADPAIRAKLLKETQTLGLAALHQRLSLLDPQAAQRIHPNDPQRIQRALEVYEATGKTLTQFWQENHAAALPYPYINLGLIPEDRETLHQRIAMRFIKMLAEGFIDEVEGLFKRGDLNLELPSMRAVGYRQAWQYLEGKLSAAQMQERAIIATRQLAKRQLTWLRSWPELQTFFSEDEKRLEKITACIAAFMEKL